MGIRTIKDIERDNERARNKRIAGDINEVIGEIFPSRKPKVKKKRWGFFKILGFLFLLIFMINLILGSIWLLKFFVTDLLGG